MWVGSQRHAPAALPPGNTRHPLYRRLGGPQGRSGRVEKISPPTGIRSPYRPARSESLYRLSYSGSNSSTNIILIIPLSSYYPQRCYCYTKFYIGTTAVQNFKNSTKNYHIHINIFTKSASCAAGRCRIHPPKPVRKFQATPHALNAKHATTEHVFQ